MTEILDELFNSHARARLLKLFLFNPEEIFTVKQVADRARLQENSVRTELNRLIKIGIIASKIRKEKTFSLNGEFCFLVPLKNLFYKATFIPDAKIIRQIKKMGKIKLAILGGIFTGTYKSPVDLLIVADSIKRAGFKNFIKDIEADLGRGINYSLMDIDEFNYRRQMCDHFIKTMLEMPHKVLIDKLGIRE